MTADSAASHVGLVLAGGYGVRLGLGRPKALVTLAGRTLLDRALDTLRAVCGEVLVVSPDRIDLGGLTVETVRDVEGARGPLAGIIAGLEARPSSSAVVLGVDYPLVRSDSLRHLLARLVAGSGEIDAVIPRPGGVPQPLAAAYAPGAVTAFRAALDANDRSLRAGLTRLRVAWVDDGELEGLPGGVESLLNVNTMADLEHARARLKEGADRATAPAQPKGGS